MTFFNACFSFNILPLVPIFIPTTFLEGIYSRVTKEWRMKRYRVIHQNKIYVPLQSLILEKEFSIIITVLTGIFQKEEKKNKR